MKNSMTIVSILIGTMLEWYDFSLLGAMAPIISDLFFPSKTSLLSLLITFSVFASGFLVRPLGGIVFGHIGDRYGRGFSLSITIVVMALSTTLIGLLPTFNMIGIMAPIMLVLLRLIQGFGASGEYPGAICFLTEKAPIDKRGLWGSISIFGVVGGMLLGSIVSSLVSFFIPTEQIFSWGWRIPFLISFPLGIIGGYVRYKMQETEMFQSAKLSGEIFRRPVVQLIKLNYKNLCRLMMLFSLGNISFYMSFVYIGAYLVSVNRIKLHQALLSNTISMLILIICVPIFGYLSDKVNRKYIMLGGSIFLLISFYPIFNLFFQENYFSLLSGQILFAIFIAIFVGPIPAITSESFPTFTRYSGVSIALNMGASIFGGTCPLVATYLVHYFGSELVPCIYPMIFALLCLFVLCNLKNNNLISLDSVK